MAIGGDVPDQDIAPGLVWAATGHRPNKLGGYSDDLYDKLVYLACKFIIAFKPSKLISGMALGWDQAIAEAAIRCNTPFIAAIPFEGQEKAWPHDSQSKYRTILQWAAEKHIISEGPYVTDTRFIGHIMAVRNQWMIEHAEAIVALYDGDSSGGTKNCLDMAKVLNCPVVNLWNDWQQLLK